MMNKIIILLTLLTLSFSNTVWFISDQDGDTVAKLTGRTNEGKLVNDFVAFYNGRCYDLEPGKYFIHVRHSSLKRTTFSPVTKEYQVKEVSGAGVTTKLITVEYPIATTEFRVTNAEETIKVTMPKPKIIEEKTIDYTLLSPKDSK
jgi:hypothetical protein